MVPRHLSHGQKIWRFISWKYDQSKKKVVKILTSGILKGHHLARLPVKSRFSSLLAKASSQLFRQSRSIKFLRKDSDMNYKYQIQQTTTTKKSAQRIQFVKGGKNLRNNIQFHRKIRYSIHKTWIRYYKKNKTTKELFEIKKEADMKNVIEDKVKSKKSKIKKKR